MVFEICSHTLRIEVDQWYHITTCLYYFVVCTVSVIAASGCFTSELMLRNNMKYLIFPCADKLSPHSFNNSEVETLMAHFELSGHMWIYLSDRGYASAQSSGGSGNAFLPLGATSSIHMQYLLGASTNAPVLNQRRGVVRVGKPYRQLNLPAADLTDS